MPGREENESFRLEEARPFSEGLAAVKQAGLWGFIDKKGKALIGLKYEDAYGFSEGLAAVWLNDKMGYIFKSGDYFWRASK